MSENMVDKGPNIVRLIIGFAMYMLLSPILLFVSAGTLNWPMAWVYVVLGLVSIISSRLIALKVHPDMLRERARHSEVEDVDPGDRQLVTVLAIYIPIIIAVIAGLDYRYNWTSFFSPGIQYLAAFLTALGYGLGVWAMAVNRFFSAVARIQNDREQYVVTDGPYRAVRHPAYAGGLIAAVTVPIMLDSAWVLIPSMISIVGIFIRTKREDRMLLDGLDGYHEYATRIRYRLIPWIW